MSFHFVFREAWLMNFNRWFLLGFTHPFQSFCFLYISCLFFPFCSSFQITKKGPLICIYLQPLVGNPDKTMWNNLLNQLKFVSCREAQTSHAKYFNADLNLWEMWAKWDWERALSYRQSAQIILSWADSEQTALAFWRRTNFFKRLVRLNYSG